jgi:2'-5' RNA ligase
MQLMALDVAVLLPADVRQRVIGLNAALPPEGSHGLRLDDDHHPHVTLTQAFVRAEELDAALDRVAEVLRGRRQMTLDITGSAHNGDTLLLTVGRNPQLVQLHEDLMAALRGYERPGGTPAAFAGGDGRVGDIMWVASYRLKSSFHHFAPHITLGHGQHPPAIEPFSFEATTVAACQLGYFCTTQRILRQWELERPN